MNVNKVPEFPSSVARKNQKPLNFDLCTYDGAVYLAKRVRQMWAEVGVDVVVSIVPIRMQDKSDSKGYAVRSNLICGGPTTTSEVYLPKEPPKKKLPRLVHPAIKPAGGEYQE